MHITIIENHHQKINQLSQIFKKLFFWKYNCLSKIFHKIDFKFYSNITTHNKTCGYV